MCTLIFKTPAQTELNEEAIVTMKNFNISIKDIQNKPFEKFMQENLAYAPKNSPRKDGPDATKEIIKVRYNHF